MSATFRITKIETSIRRQNAVGFLEEKGFLLETEKISIETTVHELSNHSEAVVLEIFGRIDASTSLILEEHLARLLQQKQYHLGLHLGELKYINSTGMGLLLQYAEQFLANEGSFCLLAIPQKIKTLFSMLGIMTVFQTLESSEAYLEYVENQIQSHQTNRIRQEEIEKTIAEEKEVQSEPAVVENENFPQILACPSCKGKISIPHYGYFRCARCYHCFHVGEDGQRLANQAIRTHTMQFRLPCKMDSVRGIHEMVVNFLACYEYREPDILAISKVFEEIGMILVEKVTHWGDSLELLIASTPTEFRALLKTPSPLFQMVGEEKNNINFQLVQKMMQEVELIRLDSGEQVLKMLKRMG